MRFCFDNRKGKNDQPTEEKKNKTKKTLLKPDRGRRQKKMEYSTCEKVWWLATGVATIGEREGWGAEGRAREKSASADTVTVRYETGEDGSLCSTVLYGPVRDEATRDEATRHSTA